MVPLAAPRNKRQALDPVFSSRARSAQAPGPYELHRRKSAMSIPESGCSHAATIHHRGRPKTRGCEECLAMGDSWVHLRHVYRMRTRRLLRLVEESSRQPALPRNEAPHHPIARARRSLGVVLRRRAHVRASAGLSTLVARLSAGARPDRAGRSSRRSQQCGILRIGT